MNSKMQSSKIRNRKKRRYFEQEGNTKHFSEKRQKKDFGHFSHPTEKSEDVTRDPVIQNSVKYYESILQELRAGIDGEMKDDFINNVLQESEEKEIELSCHGLSSHCLELLLTQCKLSSIIQRFMIAFASNKTLVCTNANASHITELLFHHAVKAIQNSTEMDLEEQKDTFVSYCINWIVEFGNFSLENLNDFLSSQYACHVLATLIRALAGYLAENNECMSKNLKFHKQEFQSQFSDISSENKEQKHVVLEQIPSLFSTLLKKLYKAVIKSENLTYCISDSSSATVVESLIFALKKRLPKSCKKMINKMTQKLFSETNKDGVPQSLLHKNASFVFDEMFKVADEDLQLELWNQYLSNHIASLVVHPVGNFVIQRVYDAIKSRSLMEVACKHTWCLFDDILRAKNYGVFVSIAKACIRLGVQQAFFMENIMKCLQCFEPIAQQDAVIPLLLSFENYENYHSWKSVKREDNKEISLKVCLQGSLVIQAILKFQKPIKAVKSLLNMSPEEIEYLAGHTQGCHVLNAYFGSVTVGDKNKEMLLQHIQPVLVNMACDRNKSLTLSRIWTCLPLKLKEMVARHLAQHQSTLKSCKSGYAIFKKFGIERLKKLQEWRQMQSNVSCMKKQKY